MKIASNDTIQHPTRLHGLSIWCRTALLDSCRQVARSIPEKAVRSPLRRGSPQQRLKRRIRGSLGAERCGRGSFASVESQTALRYAVESEANGALVMLLFLQSNPQLFIHTNLTSYRPCSGDLHSHPPHRNSTATGPLVAAILFLSAFALPEANDEHTVEAYGLG
jgi:hypothetical protein